MFREHYLFITFLKYRPKLNNRALALPVEGKKQFREDRPLFTPNLLTGSARIPYNFIFPRVHHG